MFEQNQSADDVIYVAQAISVGPAQRDRFIACLRQYAVPQWRKLKQEGFLSAKHVFETTSVRLPEGSQPAWSFLMLSRLGAGVMPEALFGAERSLGTDEAALCLKGPGIELRRLEILRATPNANYPKPALEAGVEYIVEYIAVRNSPDALNAYRDTVSGMIGPAFGQIVQQEQLYSMFAAETLSVQYAAAQMPEWNQIHIRGYFAAIGLNRSGFDAALRRVNPESGGFDGIFKRLGALRTKPREDVARNLFEIAVQ